MSKKNKSLDKIESIQSPVEKKKTYTKEELENMSTAEIEAILGVKSRPGRPVDPNSERQKRLAEKGEGTGKRGRPANPESKNYQKRMEMEAKKADPNYVPKRGRQTDPTSKRQVELAEKEQRKKSRLLSTLPEIIEISEEEVVEETV